MKQEETGWQKAEIELKESKRVVEKTQLIQISLLSTFAVKQAGVLETVQIIGTGEILCCSQHLVTVAVEPILRGSHLSLQFQESSIPALSSLWNRPGRSRRRSTLYLLGEPVVWSFCTLLISQCLQQMSIKSFYFWPGNWWKDAGHHAIAFQSYCPDRNQTDDSRENGHNDPHGCIF